MDLNLETRAGLPADLRLLADKFPREAWPGHANLGETARFWLQRHDMFRELGGILGKATAEFREGRLAAEPFRRFFAPRLQVFLQSLEEHHHIEDHHFFPLFRAAEARLAKGFDLLEHDHDVIHRKILSVVQSADALLSRMEAGADARLAATERYGGAGEGLLLALLRHLEDEEDLVIPVILERSETAVLGPKP